MNELAQHGELWWCRLRDIGTRPAVVLSRSATIPRLRRVMVAPCTTTIRGLATEVLLDPESDPVPERCVVNLDSIESTNVDAFVDRLGDLGAGRMLEVWRALEVAVDCSR